MPMAFAPDSQLPSALFLACWVGKYADEPLEIQISRQQTHINLCTNKTLTSFERKPLEKASGFMHDFSENDAAV